ncbi:haloacid dehalogenase-like hydrolase [Luteolibacter yonseiensis]|uniref:Haloacid dehalogenase-like hydrolase n=1 Tax=Luteolibacter yonseiensis TaxID=1144680 RepID=A0A934R6D3_9BACT|nr:HAD-IB family hydrolase [Luteolibacter yonseiensis]MBK1815974.1 haloacid dehalogenase-like hydrolase [Luteolibacter yonseiensis]
MNDATPPPGIALFDLDGTLIAWDCQLLFRHFILRREPWRGVFLPVFLAFLPLTGLLGAGGMKRIFLSYLYGISPEKLDEYSREFASAVMPAIYPELLERLEEQRRRGDFLILASASPEFYVKHIGRELGFHLTLGTPVETGTFFPDLENHKGVAKVERLRQILPASYFQDDRLRNCHGYTDSTADLPMLALCETATVVNPSAGLAELARGNGWKIVHPARPWISKLGFFARTLALLVGAGDDPGGISKSVK